MSTSASIDPTAISVSSPYYLGSSDTPNSILVTNLFNGVGFNAWKRAMIIALSAKHKLGFVDGSIVQPDTSSPIYSNWYRANSMVISWLLNSLHKNIADSVLFLPTATQIWNELNQRYEQSNGALIYQIQQKLYSISQGSDEFSTYYTKLMKIWDELRVVQDLPACSCNAAAALNKFLEDQKLIQLLMGLNDSYKIIRGQILMMKPLPTLSTAYALILQEEQQREINSVSVFNNEAIAMNVSQNHNLQTSKKFLTCTHCKKSGHTKSQCYRLVGFPSNFKFTKGRKEESSSAVHNVTNTSNMSFSPEQYQQLLQLLNSTNLNSSSSSSSQVNSAIAEGALDPNAPFSWSS